MKKLFSLILSLTIVIAGFAFNPASAENPHGKKMGQVFEKRLNLTEKQKEKAKVIHKKGHQEMKPVMDKMMAKRKEIMLIKKDETLSETQKQEKIDALSYEIKELSKQAADIRKKNSKDFEKILNKKQKKELEKMKAEGRANFEKNHPPRKPFDMFGAPEFWNKKPLFSPQQPQPLPMPKPTPQEK